MHKVEVAMAADSVVDAVEAKAVVVRGGVGGGG